MFTFVENAVSIIAVGWSSNVNDTNTAKHCYKDMVNSSIKKML